MKIQCESVADRRDRGGSDRELRINSRCNALAALVAKAIVIHIGVTGGGNSRPRFDHRAAGRAMASLGQACRCAGRRNGVVNDSGMCLFLDFFIVCVAAFRAF